MVVFKNFNVALNTNRSQERKFLPGMILCSKVVFLGFLV